MIDPTRKAKLTWQCRRGMLELDLVLNPFVQTGLDALDEQQIQLFESLLEQPDPLLYSWLMGSTQPEDEELASLVELVRRHTAIR